MDIDPDPGRTADPVRGRAPEPTTGPAGARLSHAGVEALPPAERRRYVRLRWMEETPERARRPDRLPARSVRRRRAVLAAVPFAATTGVALLGNVPDDGPALVAALALWVLALLACLTGPVLLRRAVGSPDDVPESELRTADLVEHRRAHRSAHHVVLGSTVALALLAMADHFGPGWQITATGWAVIMTGAAVSGSMLPSAVAAWRWSDDDRPPPDPAREDPTPRTDELWS